MSDLYTPIADLPSWHGQCKDSSRVCIPNSFVEFKKEEIEQSITDRFEQQFFKYPERLAVKAQDYKLNYDSLNKAANQMTHAILAHCGTSEEPIALLLEHGALGLRIA